MKLKEISYIHAEAYASGELKHGPIALIDQHMPVVVLAPHDGLFDKTVSNMQEVMARKGKVLLVSDSTGIAEASDGVWATIRMPARPSGAERRSSTRCRRSFWPITPPSPRARMSTSRATWRNR